MVQSSPAQFHPKLVFVPLQQELREWNEFPSAAREPEFKRQKVAKGKQFKECSDQISGGKKLLNRTLVFLYYNKQLYKRSWLNDFDTHV